MSTPLGKRQKGVVIYELVDEDDQVAWEETEKTLNTIEKAQPKPTGSSQIISSPGIVRAKRRLDFGDGEDMHPTFKRSHLETPNGIWFGPSLDSIAYEDQKRSCHL